MAVFLAIHARYKDVQWGIFRDAHLIEAGADDNKKVSKNFIMLLDRLLKSHKLALSELSFIAAHQGPAPFTTLRVCLATVNGFAFATGIPLVGINGLEGLIDEHKSPDHVTVVLLNAFCHEVYYAVHDPATDSVQYGYAPAELFISTVARDHTGSIAFLGNGVEMYKQSIEQACGTRAQIMHQDLISLENIAHRALTAWSRNAVHHQLMPVYLKSSSL